jgi:hypothetical protein
MIAKLSGSGSGQLPTHGAGRRGRAPAVHTSAIWIGREAALLDARRQHQTRYGVRVKTLRVLATSKA